MDISVTRRFKCDRYFRNSGTEEVECTDCGAIQNKRYARLNAILMDDGEFERIGNGYDAELLPQVVEIEQPEKHSRSGFDDLVKAQDRTTHAVRTLAILSLGSILVYVGIVIALAFSTRWRSTFFDVLAIGIGLIGGTIVLVTALGEFEKSKVD
jgi:hypothetical protein